MKRLASLFAVLTLCVMTLGLFNSSLASASDKDNIDDVGYNPSAVSQLEEAIRLALGEKTLKPYHQKIHQDGNNCQLCHSGEAPVSPPDDINCVRCHGSPEHLAEVTSDLERNPHDSPHYGTYVPCTTCHMEHKASKPLCSDCHTFTFENFKK